MEEDLILTAFFECMLCEYSDIYEAISMILFLVKCVYLISGPI